MNQIPNVLFRVSNLAKTFDRKKIFSEVNFQLTRGESLAITGRNGSGKSTLIKILSNSLSPTSGEAGLQFDNTKIKSENLYQYIGVVSPYLNFYEEFSAHEMLRMTARIRSKGGDRADEMLEKAGLYSRRHDSVRIFSSGMKQRLKFAFALLHSPAVLMLDEPTSNLDSEGIDMVVKVVNDFKADGIVMIATNSEYEKGLCGEEINLDSKIKINHKGHKEKPQRTQREF